MHDPWAIATWRFEQISPLLDSALARAEKRRYIRDKARTSIEWPHSGRRGARRGIARATLLRWLRSYEREGLKGMLPKPRNRDKPDRSELVAYALALLVEEPERSLNQLLVYLKLQFPEQVLSRSTLQRELTQHRAYAGIIQRKPRKLRRRYETTRPHECWQLDGKGPFRVRFADGSQRAVHVLSILDDYSRFVLACIIALAENIAGSVRVVRLAIQRFGLPTRMQFDRGSAFDSHAFREGLALLGVHRNFVRPRAPEAQGKIEAYHRVLIRWFIRELRHQQVTNLEHLEQLLWATIELFYNRHRHRELKSTPEQALAGRLSERRVGTEDLMHAFWARTNAKSHPKTGQVNLPNSTFVVPARYAGKRARFRYDPVEPRAVLVVDREHELALEPFVVQRLFASEPGEPPSGVGPLQKLLDVWRGHARPNAQPGFGLPELFTEIAALLGHLVPQDEREAKSIRDFYREFGPLHPTHFRNAMDSTRRTLGQARPLHVYLEHLARLIRQHSQPENEEPK